MFVTGGDGIRLWTRIDGAENVESLLLLNSLGCDLSLWDAQAEALAARFRVIRFDARGHGRSAAPDGEYSLGDLGRDALAVLDAAGATRAHVCGISLGGITAEWLAIHAPARVHRLVLANTAARIGTEETWRQRLGTVLSQGMAAIADAALDRFFSAGFRAAAPDVVDRFRAILLSASPRGYAACCAALRDADLRPDLDRITAPMLVIGGRFDVSTPPADSEYLARAIPAARLIVLDAAHLSNVEQPDAFTEAVRQHLETI